MPNVNKHQNYSNKNDQQSCSSANQAEIFIVQRGLLRVLGNAIGIAHIK